MPTVKHIPERQCCGCGQMFPKRELVRVVRAADGTVSLDLTGKKSGRGAYVCKSAECLNKAVKTHALERQLECNVSEEVFSQLSAQLNAEEA